MTLETPPVVTRMLTKTNETIYERSVQGPRGSLAEMQAAHDSRPRIYQFGQEYKVTGQVSTIPDVVNLS